MKSTGSFILIALIAVALLVGNIWQFQDRAKLNDALSAAGSANTEVAVSGPNVSTPSSKPKPKRQLQQPMHPAATPDDALLTSSAAQSPDEDSSSRGDNMLSGLSKMMESEEGRNAMAAQQEMAINMMYADLFKAFDLEGPELRQFKDLLVERQMKSMQMGLKFATGGKISEEERKEISDDIAQTNESIDAKIKEFLNDDEDYDYYERYNETQSERQELSQFKASLERTGSALEQDQEEELISLMYEARQNNELLGEMDFQNPANFDWENLNQERVDGYLQALGTMQEGIVEQAGSILDATQLKAFQANQGQTRAMAEMGLNMAVQMSGKK